MTSHPPGGQPLGQAQCLGVGCRSGPGWMAPNEAEALMSPARAAPLAQRSPPTPSPTPGVKRRGGGILVPEEERGPASTPSPGLPTAVSLSPLRLCLGFCGEQSATVKLRLERPATPRLPLLPATSTICSHNCSLHLSFTRFGLLEAWVPGIHEAFACSLSG